MKLLKEENSVSANSKNENGKDKDKKNQKKNKKRKNEDDKMIEVGERTQNNIEILDGLKEGDKVIVIPVGAEEEEKEEED